MTQDEIIRSPIGREQLVALAREAGIGALTEYGKEALERFAALVAAHAKAEEREACAKVCAEGTGEAVQKATLEILLNERKRIAKSIRDRGDK